MLRDKIALVTGASRGIGKAIAIEFAREGAKVIINYTKEKARAEETLKEVQNSGGQGMIIQADISNNEQVESMFSEIMEKFNKIDILVNNAGVLKEGLIVSTEEEDWNTILDTNLKGTFNCLKGAIKLMMRSTGGKIINITSIAGVEGSAGLSVYSASKAGIIGLTKSAAKELGPIGITVNAIAPGLTDTDMANDLREEQREKMVRQTPLQRMAHPHEIAKTALFLASEGANYINGQIIGVDGGMIM